MMIRIPCVACFGACLLFLTACQQESNSTAASGVSRKPDPQAAKYLLPSEPEGAANIKDARQSAKDGDTIRLVGRIGGSTDPWVTGQAAFTIVDVSLRACSDIPGDRCATPWDYCCEPDLPTASAFVKIVDQGQKVISFDAREFLALQELDTVVVEGRAQRDSSGNLTVLAQGIFLRK